MEKALFGLDNWEPQYGGFTAGLTWNGWACPSFEKAVAEQILTEYVAADDSYKWWYDESRSAFYLANNETPEHNEMWRAKTIKVDGVEFVVYAIGAQSWIWDQIDVDKQLFEQLCPNCASDLTYKIESIRGVIRRNTESKVVFLVDYTVEKLMFSECEDCGHRWDADANYLANEAQLIEYK